MTAILDAPTEVEAPDHVPPVCYVAQCTTLNETTGQWEKMCPDRFAEWRVYGHCGCCVHLVCDPCTKRWESYGSVARKERL